MCQAWRQTFPSAILLTPLSCPLGWVFCWNHHFSDKETGSAGGGGSTYMGGSRTHTLSIQVKVAGWSLEQESVTPSRICLCPFPPCTTALPPGRPRTSLILLGLLLKFCPARRSWCPLSSALISWTEPKQGCSLFYLSCIFPTPLISHPCGLNRVSITGSHMLGRARRPTTGPHSPWYNDWARVCDAGWVQQSPSWDRR